jgi:hypothetical protein
MGSLERVLLPTLGCCSSWTGFTWKVIASFPQIPTLRRCLSAQLNQILLFLGQTTSSLLFQETAGLKELPLLPYLLLLLVRLKLNELSMVVHTCHLS